MADYPGTRFVVIAVSDTGESLQSWNYGSISDAQSQYAVIDIIEPAPPGTAVLELWYVPPDTPPVFDSWRPIKPGAVSPTQAALDHIATELAGIAGDLITGAEPVLSVIDNTIKDNAADLSAAMTTVRQQIGSQIAANTRALNSVPGEVVGTLDATVTDLPQVSQADTLLPGQSYCTVTKGYPLTISGFPTYAQAAAAYFAYIGRTIPLYRVQPGVWDDLPSGGTHAITIGVCPAVDAEQPTPSVPENLIGVTQTPSKSPTVQATTITDVGQNGSTAVQCQQCGCPVNVTVAIPGLGGSSGSYTDLQGTSANGLPRQGYSQPIAPVVDFDNPFSHIAGLVSDETAVKVETWLGSEYSGPWTYSSLSELIEAGMPQPLATDQQQLQRIRDVVQQQIDAMRGAGSGQGSGGEGGSTNPYGGATPAVQDAAALIAKFALLGTE